MTTARNQAEAKLRECFPEPWEVEIGDCDGAWFPKAHRDGLCIYTNDAEEGALAFADPLAAADALIKAWKDATTPKEVMPNGPEQVNDRDAAGRYAAPGAAHPEHTPTAKPRKLNLGEVMLDGPVSFDDVAGTDLTGGVDAVEYVRRGRDDWSVEASTEALLDDEGAEIVGELQRALAASQAECLALREAIQNAALDLAEREQQGAEDIHDKLLDALSRPSGSASLRAVCEKVAQATYDAVDRYGDLYPDTPQSIVDSVLGPAQEGTA